MPKKAAKRAKPRPTGKRSPSPAKAKRRPPKKKRPAKAATPAGEPREGERLQKVLAAAGVASRRECELLIGEGRVEVDGEVVTELGVRVDPVNQTIRVDGETLRKPRLVYFAVHKPPGVVCTARDPSGRPRVIDLLPPDVGRVYNVGRLDMASEGLILVTNDGELANRLTHPRHGVEKLYQVQVAGLPDEETLERVRRGVYLDEGRVAFRNIRLKSRRKGSTLLEVTLDEGRNREIRRVLARVGHKVQQLRRVAVGPVRLGELSPGGYRPLTRDEVRALRESRSAKASETGSKPRRRTARPKTTATESGTGRGDRAKSGAKRRVIGGETEQASRSKTQPTRRKKATKPRSRR